MSAEPSHAPPMTGVATPAAAAPPGRIGMAIFLTVLKATHLEVVLGFVAVGGIFVTQILPHIWPVFLIVVVGSALIFVARRRAGRDGLTHRPTLLNKED